MSNRIREVYLSLEQYRAMMQKLYRDALAQPVRRRVLTYTLGATGRRISEVLLLTTRDIDLENNKVTWRVLKKRRGDYYITLPLSPRLRDVLTRYITFNAVGDRLFPISRTQAYLDVKATLKEYGLYGWRVHDLRHAFILEALLNTRSLELVRRWIQHSDYDMLLEYARTVGLEIDKPPVEF
jgi:integrase